MKPTKQKHGKENTIGKIIYGFLLFMPLLAIGTACLVDTFNMTAKNEANYEINYKYETNEVLTANDLIDGNIYHLTFDNQNRPTNTERLYVYDVYNISFDTWNTYGTTTQSSIPNFAFTSNNSFYYFFTNNNNYFGYQSTGSFECDFVYRDGGNYSNISTISICNNVPITSVEEIPLTEDVFYRSIDKVQQNTLFNWANNTATYNVLQDTCNTLGITTTFVPMLLSYWLMISLMYLLYDIALLVVHMAHNRIHDIESSI